VSWQLVLPIAVLCVLALVTAWLASAVHEAAHALCARSFGLGVLAVNVGKGPVVAEWHVGTALVTFRVLPGRSFVLYTWPTDRRPAVPVALTAAAGPVASIVIGGVVLWLATGSGIGGWPLGIAVIFGSMNVLGGLGNLIPIPRIGPARMGSDGWVILSQMLRLPSARAR